MSDESASVSEQVTASLPSVRQPVVSMLDIKDMLVRLSTTDTVLRRLLKATTADPRIYSYYAPSAIISEQFPAYITYAQLAFPTMTGATGNPVFSLAVWGMNLDAVEPVRDRLVKLLHEIPITTPGGRTLWGTMVGDRDSYQENTKFTGKTLQFEFGFSRV